MNFGEKVLPPKRRGRVSQYGYEKIGLKNIIALTDLDHEKSQNVLKKIGFRERGIMKTEDGDDLVFEFKNQPETV